jgi:hypothetical protein
MDVAFRSRRMEKGVIALWWVRVVDKDSEKVL